jgi:TfoX/Sxy family transcriptional regulator of competence genes
MASDLKFVEFVCDQISAAGQVSYRKMFGEYAVYCDEKVVALICDNRLYVKPTAAGRDFIGAVVEAVPYQGAKPCFLIETQLEDLDWLTQLMRITAQALPLPKPKKAKAKNT